VYAADKADLSTYELYQWLLYLSYAGFDHVYVYDAYERPEEALKDVLKPWVDEGFVTYTDWSAHTPYDMAGTQVSSYNDALSRFGPQDTWQAFIDIDEFPFSEQVRSKSQAATARQGS
jgi:hypothetical protein